MFLRFFCNDIGFPTGAQAGLDLLEEDDAPEAPDEARADEHDREGGGVAELCIRDEPADLDAFLLFLNPDARIPSEKRWHFLPCKNAIKKTHSLRFSTEKFLWLCKRNYYRHTEVWDLY